MLSTCPTTLSTCELVVDDTVGGKDIMEKETRKVNDKWDVLLRLEFFSTGCDMLWRLWLTCKFFILSACLTTLSTYELVADATMDGKDNEEKKTRGVSDIMMYHFS